MGTAKSFPRITASDLASCPVWRHKAAERLRPGEDESWIEPVNERPISDAFDHYFGVAVTLADGTTEVALVGKTEASSPEISEKNQLFVFFRPAGQHHWTNSPSWYSPEATDPAALASFLGKTASAVFPFTYDLSSLLVGHPNVLRRAVMPITVPRAASAIEAAMAAAEEHLNIVRKGRK
jgi:hypothetical protein